MTSRPADTALCAVDSTSRCLTQTRPACSLSRTLHADRWTPKRYGRPMVACHRLLEQLQRASRHHNQYPELRHEPRLRRCLAGTTEASLSIPHVLEETPAVWPK